MCSDWQVTPPPSKKAKPNTSGSKNDEEPSWLLEKNRFVKVREYRGSVYIDIREYYESDGDLKPAKKGGCECRNNYIKYCDQLVMLCFDINISEQIVKQCCSGGAQNESWPGHYHGVFLSFPQ